MPAGHVVPMIQTRVPQLELSENHLPGDGELLQLLKVTKVVQSSQVFRQVVPRCLEAAGMLSIYGC